MSFVKLSEHFVTYFNKLANDKCEVTITFILALSKVSPFLSFLQCNQQSLHSIVHLILFIILYTTQSNYFASVAFSDTMASLL